MRVFMRINYGYFSCQVTLSLQNYSNFWMITNQENWFDHFMLLCSQIERLSWLDGILVSLVGSDRSLLNVNLYLAPPTEILASWWISPKRTKVLQGVIKIINYMLHFKNISRDFEQNLARTYFLPDWAWSPIGAFKKVWAWVSLDSVCTPATIRTLWWGANVS